VEVAEPVDDRATKLLVKAVRQLPEREQDQLLAALLRAAIVEPGRPAAGVEPTFTHPVPPSPQEMLMWARPGAMPAPIGMTGPAAMLPVRLPPDLHERLRGWSGTHGFSMASVVRGLVERFLDEQEGKQRRSEATTPARKARSTRSVAAKRKLPTARG
jgi:hypothetical protein